MLLILQQFHEEALGEERKETEKELSGEDFDKVLPMMIGSHVKPFSNCLPYISEGSYPFTI